MKYLLATTALVGFISVQNISPAIADEYTYAPQLAKIKLDRSIQAFGNYGKGITIAVVDTGVNPNHIELAGRVSAQSTCVATGNCWYGYNDTNFHGTFVASIAAGALNNAGMVGVAPSSTILAVKIAQPSGSAYTTDLNAGLLAAAQRGAQVINLSYGSFFAPSATPYYGSLNASLVSTLNAVAAKNSTTVIAGGNSATTFMGNANQGGFTSAALSRMLYVGSVNNANTLSSFSNTPGTTKFTTTDGKTVSLSSLWIMAPGENLIGAYYGANNYYVQASGTSFSAPQVSGGLALLESRWPVLYKNGTAAQVLLTTATDLGAKGVDTVYGAGLMDMNKAFQPVGNLVIPNAKGTKVNVTSITGSMITSGAFGTLTTIKSKLANMSAFDNFSRDFSINLSGLIQAKPTAATVVLPHGTQVVGSSYKFAEGGAMSFGQSVSTMPLSYQQSHAEEAPKNFYMSMTDKEGTTTAAGYGFSAAPSFNEALWGAQSFAASDAAALDVSNGLLSLAQGGAFLAYGEQLDQSTRYALSWAQSDTQDDSLITPATDTPTSMAIGLGMTKELTPTWTGGMTFNLLEETDQWLGASYANSPLGFGEKRRSASVGISSAFDLGNDRHLVLDTSIIRGQGGKVENSLIESVSDIYAQSLGVSYTEQNSFTEGDQLSIGIKQPMRIIAGDARMTTTGVDVNGDPVISSENVSLKPDGIETDLTIGYKSAITETGQWSAEITARHNDGNVSGENALGFMMSKKLKF